MNGVKILVCDAVHEDGLTLLKEHGFQIDKKTSITEHELVNLIGEYDAVVVRSRTKVTREVLIEGKKLKVIARSGVGLDNVNVKEAEKRGVKVVHSPEAPSNAAAELTIGLILSLARDIPKADSNLKKGRWIKNQLQGFELKGKTIGIIGFGRIGYLVAKKAKALEMRVLVYDIIIDELMEYVDEVGAVSVGLEELLSSSDIVSLHVPLLPQTRHLISVDEIDLMKDGALIINVSRGSIVDESALKEALLSGKLGGAALDVFENEPPTDTSLTGLEKVVCTPHIGSATLESQRENSIVIAQKIIKIFSNM